MDNITSPETLDAFVSKIVDGAGTFFKPLSKSDLYKLAMRIRELEMEVRYLEVRSLSESVVERDSPQTTFSELVDIPSDRTTSEDHPCEDDKARETPPPQADSCDEESDASDSSYIPIAVDDDEGSERPMPRREELAFRGLDAQDAFDEFLKAREKDPKRYSVMDFSTGQRSVAAAFAFWLTEPVL